MSSRLLKPDELRKPILDARGLNTDPQSAYRDKLHYVKQFFENASKDIIKDLIKPLSGIKNVAGRYNAGYLLRYIRHSADDVHKHFHKIFKEDDYKYGKEGQRFIEDLYDILPNNLGILQMEGGAFPVDHESKAWTRKKVYKKWVRKLERKTAKRTAKEDLCVGKKSICKGHIGIVRKYMPQFNSPAEIKQFTRFVKKVYGIKSHKTRKMAKELKSSQREISKKRVQGLIDDNITKKVRVPILISGNNYVIDGHHRWAAYKLAAPKKKIPAVVIDAPIKDVLGIAVAWGAKHQEF
jgi:hypothetical protein